MIEILDSRELTPDEKKRYELQQEIKQKQQELDELNNKCAEADSKKQRQQDVESLTPEEEQKVTEAIKKENQKDCLSDEELQRIKEETQREYESIASDVKFSIKRALIFIAIMVILIILSSVASYRGKQERSNIKDIIQNTDEITVNIDDN